MPRPRPLRIGVLGTEFFDQSLGRMGGFGWAARRLVEVFNGKGDPPIEVVLLAGSRQGPNGELSTTSHGTRLLYGSGDARRDVGRLWRERLDLLFAVDWSPRYLTSIRVLPRTPFVGWVRDPRPASVARSVATLTLPDGSPAAEASSSVTGDRSIKKLYRESRLVGRPLVFAGTAEFLLPQFNELYDVSVPIDHVLPNPLTIVRTREVAEQPTVAFLGRLDPVKRPWLVVELARRHPDVRFELAGGRYVDEWDPGELPANVFLVGHLGEEAKADLLSRAWCMVNTSIHEGLPVSVCEALRVGTPLLSTIDSSQVGTRFGVYAGSADGDGLDLVPALDLGLQRLLHDADLRTRASEEGREWALARHSVPSFLAALESLLDAAGARGLGHQLAASARLDS
jgi:glycosyltransferase involved in cell wall biosynthesis